MGLGVLDGLVVLRSAAGEEAVISADGELGRAVVGTRRRGGGRIRRQSDEVRPIVRLA